MEGDCPMADTQQTSSQKDDAQGVPRSTAGKAAPSIGELFGLMSNQVSSLIRGEIELTKSKAVSFVTRMGRGIGLLVGAGILTLYLLGWIFHSIEMAIAVALPRWASALIVVGLLLIIVLILALLGVRELKRAKETTPAPKEGLSASVAAFKKGLRHE